MGGPELSTTIVKCLSCGKRNRVPAAAVGKPRCAQCHSDLPWIAEAGDAEFAEIVEKASLPVLVDMWATWCGPCRTVSPALEQLAAERAGDLKLVKIDVDKAPQLAQRFSVRAVPTLMIFDHGKMLARQAGAAPVATLRTWLDQTLSGRDST